MRGVFLDTATLGDDIDLTALKNSVEHWTFFPLTAPDDVQARLRDAEVVVTNKVVLDAQLIASLPNLRCICLTATGTNNVDLAAAQHAGIPVLNVTNYAGASVAQHVVAMTLALATQWHLYSGDVRNGVWSAAPAFCLMHRPVIELAGKTFGIIGYGALGRAVANAVAALGMKVVIAQSHSGQRDENRVTMTELLAQSDVISLHCPLTEATEKMVNADFLTAMKSSAFLINSARGGLVDEFALREALLAGEIGGAALDVLTVEPPPLDHPLVSAKLDNLIITPHNAWISLAARQRLIDQVANNIKGWKAGQLRNCVNGVKP